MDNQKLKEDFIDNQKKYLKDLAEYFGEKGHNIPEISILCATMLLNVWVEYYDEEIVYKIMEDIKTKYQNNMKRNDEPRKD